MKKSVQVMVASAALVLFASPTFASDAPDGAKLFSQKCKMCHALDRKKIGPAVKTMNADAEVLRTTITDGRKRMPKFGHKFSAEQIDALVVFIQSVE